MIHNFRIQSDSQFYYFIMVGRSKQTNSEISVPTLFSKYNEWHVQ